MSESPRIEFFYDCSSPWTYFAFTRILPMAQSLGLAIEWRPILVGGVFNAVNQEVYASREAMFRGENQRRLNYYIKDLQDWARLCGVKAIMPPGHPISSVKAMRGAFFALEQDLGVPYSRAVFEAYWGGETPDISSDDVLAAICEDVAIIFNGGKSNLVSFNASKKQFSSSINSTPSSRQLSPILRTHTTVSFCYY